MMNIRDGNPSRSEDHRGAERLFTMSDKLHGQLKLHGLHKDVSVYIEDVDSDLDNISLPDEDPLERMAAAAVNMGRKSREAQSSGPRPPSRSGSSQSFNAPWKSKRRHSLQAARKNNDWTEFFLSTAASPSHIAGFLSFREDCSEPQYYLNPIPNSVVNQDMIYKELLAVYNALRFWTKGSGTISGKKVLLVVGNTDGAKLLRKSLVKSKKCTPQQILILREINAIINQQKVDIRVSTVTPECAVHTATYALARSASSSQYKLTFKRMLVEQEQLRGGTYKTQEVIFPPVYV